MAVVLAPLLDSGSLHAEGTVIGTRNAYNIPISIELFAPAATANVSLSNLTANRLGIRKQPTQHKQSRPLPQPAPQYVSASTAGGSRQYEALLRSSTAFDPRSLRDAPEKFGLSIKDLEDLPMAKQPYPVKTKMLPYQLQGLAWLLKMEHPKLPDGKEVRQFWTRRGTNWLNVATN